MSGRDERFTDWGERGAVTITPSIATGVHQHQHSGEWYVLRWHGGGPAGRIVGAVHVVGDHDIAYLVAVGSAAYYDGCTDTGDPTADAGWAALQPWGPPTPPAELAAIAGPVTE